jgi:hypothetical protein
VYDNRAVLWVETRWGKIHRQEDHEDTERAAAFDPTRPANDVGEGFPGNSG